MKDAGKSDPRRRAIVQIVLFAVLTLLTTWSTGMLVVLSTHAELVNGAHRIPHPISLPFPVAITLIVIGGWAPGLVAVLLSALEGSRTGLRELFRQFHRWRIHPWWYVVAFLGPGLLGFVALLATALSGGATPKPWFYPPSPRLLGLAVGPWGEELGWRGYAQPRLQQGVSALTASLVVGTIWSCWHYWPVLTPAGGPWSEFFSASFATWLSYELANSVMMAWLYNSTGGSLPVAWAAHAGLTLGQSLVNSLPIPFGCFVVTFWAAAVLIIILNGPRTLSRSRKSSYPVADA
jgi:membrane protease YdiL (CAAX protease family)